MQKITQFLQSYRNEYLNGSIFIYFISVFALINISSIYPDIYSIYSKNGIISEAINNKFVPANKLKIPTLVNEIISVSNLEYKYAFIIPFIIYILSLIMLILNYSRIFFAILTIFLHTTFLNSAYLLSYGADFMISFLLYINFFFCIEEKIKSKKYKGIVFSFAIRLTQIQLCIIYFFGGFGKAMGYDWYNGDAIWLCVNHYLDEKIIDSYFSMIPNFFYQLVSLHILFIELLFPLLVFCSVKIRKFTIIDIIIMHFFIAIIIKLYTFSFAMILLNTIAFYPSKYITVISYFKNIILSKKNKPNYEVGT